MQSGKVTIPIDRPLPFVDAAYNFLWRWLSTLDKRHVDLNPILICSTNMLVNEHNQRARDAFPGSERVFSVVQCTCVHRERHRAHRCQGNLVYFSV